MPEYSLTEEILKSREKTIKFYNEAFPHIHYCFKGNCPKELELP